MKIKFLFLFTATSLLFLFSSCDTEKPVETNRLVIAIPSDVESLNPLYSFSADEGNIAELLYSGLVYHEWNYEKGEMETFPMLAEKWEWNNEDNSVTFYLREDVKWTDGTPFTAEDVVFSFDMYSDPDVESRMYGTFDNFYTEEDLSINLEKTFDILSPGIIKINFIEDSNPSIFNVDFPIIPKHTFASFERKDFYTLEKGLDSVNIGPYKFDKWEKNQSITLKANENSFLYSEEKFDQIIFKIVPDYNSRLTQLKKGEVDFMEDVQTDDITELKEMDEITIDPVEGRIYDYIGWSVIDNDYFNETGNIRPHNIFGNSKIREALTYAINRNEILNQYLYNYGQLAVSPIPPIFKSEFNDELVPYTYQPEKAKQLLNEEGWIDSDNDGVLERNDEELKFKMFLSTDNPRREFAATVYKNNYAAIGVQVDIQKVERGDFIERMFAKEFDCWMSGWFVPVPYDILPYWGSDLEASFLNISGFQNDRVDQIISELINTQKPDIKNSLMKEFQEIMYKEKPVTFLYWVDNLTCYNNNVIDNIDITPLGALHNCWKWTANQE